MYHVALEFKKQTLAEIEDILRTSDAEIIKVSATSCSEINAASDFLKENNITGIDLSVKPPVIGNVFLPCSNH